MGLFRQAVVAHQQRRIGRIILTTPRYLHRIVWLSVGGFCGTICWILWQSFPEQIVVAGELAYREPSQHILAPFNGVVAHWHVKTGERVDIGMPLVTLISQEAQINADFRTQQRWFLQQQLQRQRQQVELEINQQTAELMHQRHLALPLQERLAAALAQAQAQSQITQQSTTLATRLETNSSLVLSQHEYLAHRQQHLQVIEQQTQTDMRVLQYQDALAENAYQQQRLTRQVDLLKAQLSEQEASLNQQLRLLDVDAAQVIYANKTGIVDELLFAPGANVRAHQALSAVLPQAQQLSVTLFLTPRDYAQIAEAQPISVNVVGLPAQVYGTMHGRIDELGSTPQQMAQTQLYTAQASLEGQPAYPLKAGMPLEVRITKVRRRIWQWLWAPLSRAVSQWEGQA
jgi:multidrug resistance efflux pump